MTDETNENSNTGANNTRLNSNLNPLNPKDADQVRDNHLEDNQRKHNTYLNNRDVDYEVTMKQDAYGCEDGITKKLYVKGETYTMKAHLAEIFLDAGVCDDMKPDLHVKTKQTHPNKAMSKKDYENKARLDQQKKDDEALQIQNNANAANNRKTKTNTP